ncbi:hypothetical protein C8A00DRAFT_19297 [Chaetomidium leptoderma]|uniref:NACHT domain-containing protein n=1 Tax=Chaetomidium leptoderma TaxID=669021 RepID=A0AAN6VCN6_9PEZI|nr:hypothetical protein C8A00DRAFT_19297 [Chaetomidium leptoderma]
MEALAAIGLTANILQFIEITGQLISSTHQLSSQGATTEYLELESIAQELRTLAEGIGPQQAQDSQGADDGLGRLGTDCINITNELLSVLGSLKLQGGGKNWESFYQALRSIWKAEEIKALQERVDRIGQALNRHLMVSQQRTISRKLDQLAVENRRLQASRTDDIKDLGAQFGRAFNDLQEEVHQQRDQDAPMSVLLGVAEKEIQYSAEQAILDKFRFDGIDDRYESIPLAHNETFTWVFGTAGDATVPLSSFTEWLGSKRDVFWVSGKPGSGKSTLMKYLCTHQETKRKLQDWAKHDSLIMADFFFWNAAKKPLQKSQQGLLRALLYQILRQSPKTIEQIYPEVARFQDHKDPDDMGNKALQVPNPPTTVPGLLSMLHKACELLASSKRRCCFFIDGLDEYEGRPNDIIELIRIFRHMPSVKICISSRPWNEFEQSFGQDGCCKIYMQDLNRDDIRNYVSDVFQKDSNYQALDEDDEAGADLIDEIIEAAQGVFLWVILVVRSLQEGLVNGDRIVDLEARLRQLPRDLNEYFEKILLSDVDKFYRPQSARMFAATLNAQDRLPLMAYWFMGQDDANYAFELGVCPLGEEQMNKRFEQTRKQLNACCKGLLEPHYRESYGVDEDMLSSDMYFECKVDFLHRTVKDFLDSQETRAFLSSWSQGAFDSDTSICCALLAQIKTAPRIYSDLRSSAKIPNLLTLFFLHYRALNGMPDCDSGLLERLLDQLDATLHEHNVAMEGRLYHEILDDLYQGPEFTESGLLEAVTVNVTFLHVCVRYNLGRYVARKLDYMHDEAAITALLPRLLRLALMDTDRPMVQLLLQRRASPNDFVIRRESNWTLFLQDLYNTEAESKKPLAVGGGLIVSPIGRGAASCLTAGKLGVYVLVRDLLENGADTAAVCTFAQGVTAYDVLNLALLPEHMALLEHFFSKPSDDTKISWIGATRGRLRESTRRQLESMKALFR